MSGQPASLTNQLASIGQSFKQQEQQQASNNNNNNNISSLSLMAPSLAQDLLIESTFNQLAKKTLEELKQLDYSATFFRAIDEIIKEPPRSLLAPKRALGKQPQQTTQARVLQPTRAQDEPRSLPSYTANRQEQFLGRLGGPKQAKLQPVEVNKRQSKELLARSTTSNSCKSTTSSSPSGKHNLRKSSTASAMGAVNSQLASRRIRSQSNSKLDKYQQQLDDQFRDSDDDQDDDDDESQEEEDDDEDEDDLDEDDDLTLDVSIGQDEQLDSRKKFSEINVLQQQTKQNNFRRQQVLQPVQQVNQNQQQPHQPVGKQQRFNPIVRSNTICASRNQHSAQFNGTANKPAVFNSRDMGNLYKPHMNYSTSLLGNHRLSDDDEIIIIPTQSPSLMSSQSPDAQQHQHQHQHHQDAAGQLSSTTNNNNNDELTERFSISRTKNFWEKLSKGSNGKRSAKSSNSEHENHQNSQAMMLIRSNQQQQHHRHLNGAQKQRQNPGEKLINGIRVGAFNGHHSRTLDRMDSTGGSNSNYSCSSSGDENATAGPHSQQIHPRLDQLQEMSRQNRLRQTR